jgi:YebC/PmpR family DNA-binding regulatory protein
MAGHSKWANIKHRKGRQDTLRGKIFTRLGKEITIAARDGGGDPDMNPRLRLAVKMAKSNSMPNDNIKRAIQKGTGEGGGAAVEEITFEGYAPGGIAVVVETMTDNRNRTVSEVRSTFTKANGNLGENGAVMWTFERKGTISVKNNGKSEDDLMEAVLESGAEDLEFAEESSRIICAMSDYGTVTSWFDENGFEMEESQLEYIPKEKQNIDDVSTAKKVLKFMDKMEDLDDVQNVFSNFEIDDSIADELD